MITPTYAILIKAVRIDGEDLYEARIREFPDFVEYGDTAMEAHAVALAHVETLAEVFAQAGRPMPAVLDHQDEYTGRVTLRLPKSLHRDLCVRAEAEGCSLNYYIVSALSFENGCSMFGRSEWILWQDDTVRRAAGIGDVSAPPYPKLARFEASRAHEIQVAAGVGESKGDGHGAEKLLAA